MDLQVSASQPKCTPIITTFGKPTFIPHAGVPVRDYAVWGQPAKPPSKINRYILVFQSQVPAFQYKMPVHQTHASMYNFPGTNLPPNHRPTPQQQVSRRSISLALQKLNILTSPNINNSFRLFDLPIELRFQIYDHVNSNQTFPMTSQHVRGSAFSQLIGASRRLLNDITEWQKSKPALIPLGQTGWVDFESTTFLIDFYTDRREIAMDVIADRASLLGEEPYTVRNVKHVCVDIRTDVRHNDVSAILQFLKFLDTTMCRFQQLETLTLVYNSGDAVLTSPQSWFTRRWLDEDDEMDLHRLVWRLMPVVMGFCWWGSVCTCCIGRRPLIRGFDVRRGVMEVLNVEEEYWVYQVNMDYSKWTTHVDDDDFVAAGVDDV